MSYKPQSYIFCVEMVKSKNYINKDGKNPDIGLLIKWDRISFGKEDLGENKWLGLIRMSKS
jgi:hypothetical protein